MKRLFLLFTLIIPSLVFAEAGVIVPRGSSYPNDKILSIEKMRVDVKIDGLFVNVKIMQIFKNHKNYDQEGEYIFTMPDNAMISNFAIWEDGNRIKGVIMEKKKARSLYQKIKARLIDPGLFEQENDFSVNKFKVNVYPIIANGYKRIEIEYTELLPINFLTMSYYLPLKPVLFKNYNSIIKNLEFNFSYNNKVPYGKLRLVVPFDYKNNSNLIKNKNTVSFQYKNQNIAFDKDFIFTINYNFKTTNFDLLTYKDLKKLRIDYSPDNNGKRYQDKTGFFKGDFYLNENVKNTDKTFEAKNIVIIFDRSLSMKWLKLSKSVEVFKKVLDTMHAGDKFKLLTFSNVVEPIFNDFKDANEENIKTAYKKLLEMKIKNGTDILSLVNVLKKEKKNTYIYWITDGQATLNEIRDKKLLAKFKQLTNLKFFILGVGFDANRVFLNKITTMSNGYYLHFFENEDVKLKMELFNKAINQEPLYDFTYNLKDKGNFSDIYTLQHGTIYNKSVYSIVGKYDKAIKTTIGVNYKKNKEKKLFNLEFPENNTKNEYIKRIWAKARIDYLLELINNEGEKKAWINEIIALSKEFTIVTPYTSFLAAPRSLIRPRSIIPGDPVLRVKTDKNISSVIAKFEFGLTKKLNFIANKNIWQVRFLAPDYLKDGDYKVDLFLTERDGTSIIETKYITIDSTPPIIKKRYKLNGDNLKLIVDASSDTKKIYAYVDDKILNIKYSKKEGHSIAILPNGRSYKNKKIKYILEDFAHNSSTIYDVISFGE